MEENKTKSPKQLIVGIVVAVLLLGFAIFTLVQKNQLVAANDLLQTEKAGLEEDLKDQIARYEELEGTHTELSDELQAEKERIAQLLDSVQNLDNDVKKLRRFKNSYYSYKRKYNALKAQYDSIQGANELLTQNLDSANQFISQQSKVLDSVNSHNTALSDQVTQGSRILISGLKATGMKKKSSGKLVENTKASRVNVIQVKFTATKNILAQPGKKSAQVQVLNPKGMVVRVVNSVTLADGSIVEISGDTPFEYDNENTEVITLIDVDKKTNAVGKYAVSVYIDGEVVGQSSFMLK